MLDLRHEIVEVELVLGDFLLQAACFFLVVLFLSLFHERHDVSHAQDTVGHTRRMELVDGFHFLSRADEFDGLVHYRTDRQGRPAPGVAVQFGEHHAVEVQTVVEFLGCVHGILSGHGIYHEERLVGVDTVLDGGDFLHHLFVHRQASGRIDDDHVVTFGLGFFHSVLCNLHGILVVRFAIYGDADLFAQHFQLFDGRRTIDVASRQ